MLAGGIADDYCVTSKLRSLFALFKSLDEEERAFQGEKRPVAKLGKEELILSRIEGEGQVNLEIYSRMTRMDNGRWVTVQMRRWVGWASDRTVLEIFDDKGRSVASVDRVECDTGNLLISKQEMAEGKAAIIQGALRAVTGQGYRIDVLDK